MNKKTGYRIFATAYRMFCVLPVRRDRVFSVMTHDPSKNGNIRTMERFLVSKNAEGRHFTFTGLSKSEREAVGAGASSGTGGMTGTHRLTAFVSRVSFIFKNSYNMARAQYILMDNVFLPMSFFKVRKGTKVIQFWHGTGTIKKFGQDSNTGELKELEYRHNRNLDALIVNSQAIAPRYAGAFGIAMDKVYALGLPVTDRILRLPAMTSQPGQPADSTEGAGAGSGDGYGVGELQRSAREALERYAGQSLSDKKLILYAPTFRDSETAAPRMHLDTERLLSALPKDYILLARLHPFVAANCRLENSDRLLNVTDYPDLNGLFDAADALVTDYSSVVFDYCLTDKPMYFVADDLQEFSDHGRGFYESYEEFVPGPVAKDEEMLAELILAGDTEPVTEYRNKRHEFINRFYDYRDGRACERIYSALF